ncbi:short-chain dehydrogenase [Amycolatopsis mediterranei S699]|uniref:Short-chain dehydrogenase n=2 Tax=Amycolatopsis mediterranei TaxID=33910 RepID=A0A0H3D4H9_AMYMU|nr:SDR family NAD(P)-dependent oxidoreductase [Amycolatopsis mediterranei]ADJ45581.1 short-chain dehydrogenase [Amycolatopsis mediterranei U32]AEK42357.1 short-chain dehydrogenase [Amycolatopsis mediterranei S699]AFO77293.1 short-chain dehydrogenase [Amycolatopsis mediterranei S699]AGT84421.1 short-chain dehydrogenase [Amycolatopsis mediterranei RB]KDO05839.1 short-chain dehydrogenase [Amycolatopsis mediterranei]
MTEPGTVLITGPTRNLGRHAVLAMAGRPEERRPDLLLVGRAGRDLTAIADEARALGAHVHEIGCDLAKLADVRAAAATARGLLADGVVRPLRALVANAGTMSADTRQASPDGYELTFAVNYLAHAQLIGDLLDSFTAPARVVLVGSNTYHANFWRKLLHVPPAEWADPVSLARPAAGEEAPGMTASGVAYSNAKLAILYYAHELQRRAAAGIGVAVFEPGWMPGTALGRGAPAGLQAISRALGRIPGVSTPQGSGPLLAALALDDRWAHLRDGAFVIKTKQVEARPVAHDRNREQRLWEATTELLARAATLR